LIFVETAFEKFSQMSRGEVEISSVSRSEKFAVTTLLNAFFCKGKNCHSGERNIIGLIKFENCG